MVDRRHHLRILEDPVQDCAHLSGPSGIIEELDCVSRDPLGLVNVCVARLRTTLRNSELGTPMVLRAACVGKGMTAEQARASAIGEAVERYSGIFTGEEVRIKASYLELRDRAIHPYKCMNYSARQYRDREAWNEFEGEHNWVPNPFDEEREIEWSRVWSLTTEEYKYIATAWCYFGFPSCKEHDFCRPDSNGNAAAANFEAAVLKGFLEVVERDAVALWWYNRVRRPGVDLESFGEPYFTALGEFYRILGRDMQVLDIHADFPIPVFVALSRGRNGRDDLLFGFGAHLEPCLAIVHALTEMNQSLAGAIAHELPQFFVGTPLEETFLRPDPTVKPKTCPDYASIDSEDLHEVLSNCVEWARKRGMETLVLDQTRPDVGMRAVKVIVPGMRPWWARFAPGRLYDAPVEMGWQTTPLTEERLNPCHLIV